MFVRKVVYNKLIAGEYHVITPTGNALKIADKNNNIVMPVLEDFVY